MLSIFDCPGVREASDVKWMKLTTDRTHCDGTMIWTGRPSTTGIYRSWTVSLPQVDPYDHRVAFEADVVVDDPPFYLKHTQSTDEDSAPANAAGTLQQPGQSSMGQKIPVRSASARLPSSESNSADFRSVIDDLTVENKKLKRRIRRYEKLYRSRLEDDRLFEVRIHGLQSEKKKKLEKTLRDFALNLEHSTDYPIRHPGLPQVSVPAAKLPTLLRASSSGETNISHPVDSAYASMSASGQTSTPLMHFLEKQENATPRPHIKELDIESYLHDIPQGLLPNQSHVMTEEQKRRLVVRRLEQVFVGKGANGTEHSQSVQQQEVSQSAAKAERHASEARGQQVRSEGVREARIQPGHGDFARDQGPGSPLPNLVRRMHMQAEVHDQPPDETDITCGAGPEQRPTRPIDLDPSRAQIPADNIEYIRHLGLASPLPMPTSQQAGANNWTYLNLLISMAQLHTLNVTSDFVRNAIIELSDSLEISPDGRKIRWKGVGQVTQISSDNDSADGDEDDDEVMATQARRPMGCKDTTSQRQPGHDLQDWRRRGSQPIFENPKDSSSDLRASARRRPIVMGHVNTDNHFSYKPLFFHGTDQKQGSNSSLDDESESSLPSSIVEGDTGTASGSDTHRSSSSTFRTGQTQENGPITYYSGAAFCTDLSGDPSGGSHEDAKYVRLTSDVLGYRSHAPWEIQTDDVRNESSTEYRQDFAALAGSKYDSNTELDGFEGLKLDAMDTADSSKTVPLPFDFSGLGGVQPADNFAVIVRTLHQRPKMFTSGASPFSSVPIPRFNNTKFANQMLTDAFGTSQHRPYTIRTRPDCQIIEIETIQLAPSILPMPSYLVNALSSSESNNEEEMEYLSAGGQPIFDGSDNESDRVARPRHIRSLSSNSTKSSMLNSSSDVSDDSSMDLLAHARELDPEAVAAREREFEGIIQSPLHVFIGSSAATGGGKSIISTSSSSNYSASSTSSQRRRAGLKRARSLVEDVAGEPSKIRRTAE